MPTFVLRATVFGQADDESEDQNGYREIEADSAEEALGKGRMLMEQIHELALRTPRTILARTGIQFARRLNPSGVWTATIFEYVVSAPEREHARTR
jgi:hypothetical protein